VDLNWSLWWRYKVFLTVCRLQRHWKIAKRPAGQTVPLADKVAG
jgi:hypothetical protein